MELAPVEPYPLPDPTSLPPQRPTSPPRNVFDVAVQCDLDPLVELLRVVRATVTRRHGGKWDSPEGLLNELADAHDRFVQGLVDRSVDAYMQALASFATEDAAAADVPPEFAP